MVESVADPGFPRGHQSLREGANLLFDHPPQKKLHETKKFWPGVGLPLRSLDQPLSMIDRRAPRVDSGSNFSLQMTIK